MERRDRQRYCGVSVNSRLWAKLEREAAKLDRPKAWVIRQVLAQHFGDVKLAQMPPPGRPKGKSKKLAKTI